MFDPDRFIADRVRRVDASGIRKVFDLAATVEAPVNLSIGQPDFDVPEPIKEAAIRAIRSGENRYTVTQGIEPLRERVADQFNRRFRGGGRWDDYGCLVTSGVSGGLLLALLTCAGPGDEVLIPDPYFVMYKHLVTLTGARPVFVDTYPDFELTPERVEPHLTDRSRLLLLGSPANPTGTVVSEARCRRLVDLADRHDLLLISDEIYDVFCYETTDTPVGPRCPSPAAASDRILVLRGLSKTYAMTGWRLGYVVGPRPIVEQMIKVQQYTFVCAPSMVQHAAVAALDVDMTETVRAYRRRRDRVVDRLAPQFDLVTPGGAFYAFPAVPTGETGAQFVERAIQENLLIIPGHVFSERDTHFRLAYTSDEETLERGLDILESLV